MAVDVGLHSRRIIHSISQRRIYRDVFEIGLVAIAFLCYFLVRGSVVDHETRAISHALRVIDIEKALGFFWEPDFNSAVRDNAGLSQLFNQVYFWLDFPLIVAIGLWMYFFGHKHEYTVTRDALLASGAIALIVYHTFPVAPPRLLPPGAGFGFVDTLKEYSSLSYQADSTAPFVNPYAAMPSLHYGWAILVGGVLFWTTRNLWLRALGLSWPVLQLLSIVFTANHFILDAMAGLVVALMGLLIAMALQHWGYAAVRRLVERVTAAET